MTKLYDLTAEYAAIQQAAEEGADVGALLATLADSIEAKGAGIARVLANLEADVIAFRAEEGRLGAKRSARESEIKRLREYVKACMEAAKLTGVKGGTFTIAVYPGKPKVEVDDLEALKAAAPELVVGKTTEAPDKRGILARYEQDGECLPGVRIEPTTTLRIR